MDGTIGEIRMFAGNFAPRSWAFCDGQTISIPTNTALFSVIGTTYGGDGRTIFKLPDLRGRVAMHAGTGAGLQTRILGQELGVEDVTLSVNQMAQHNHLAQSAFTASNLNVSVPASTAAGNKKKPTGNVLAVDTNDAGYSDATPDTTLGSPIPVSGSGSITTTVANTGSGQPINNIQPSGVVNYIICTFGTYPTRS